MRPIGGSTFTTGGTRPRLAAEDSGLILIREQEKRISATYTTGVWISADSATILRWSPQVRVRHRIVSTVLGHHRSTGRPPTEPHPAAEGHRREHMRTFFNEVARVVPGDDDLLLVGDGEVVDHFADDVRAQDERHGHQRRIVVEKSGPLTDRQLLARIRAFAGSPARRTLPR
jgi:hypothetical protein